MEIKHNTWEASAQSERDMLKIMGQHSWNRQKSGQMVSDNVRTNDILVMITCYGQWSGEGEVFESFGS